MLGTYRELRDRCAVVKLVGTARSAADVLPVLELLRDASTPVIAMAMGAPGTCTRLLAPAFPQALLTYGAASTAAATAPGQITVDEMTDRYALHLVTPKPRCTCTSPGPTTLCAPSSRPHQAPSSTSPSAPKTPPPSPPA